MLDNAGLKDMLSQKMVASAAKRQPVAHLQATLGMSSRSVQARSILARWVDDYNTEGPHSSLR